MNDGLAMLHLTLRQLEIFCAVAQSGSTVAAADAVGLSQSATSAALQQLEGALNTLLFERVGRSLVLNDAGRALLPQALSLLEQARSLEQALGNGGAGLPVRLLVAASTTVGSYVLPPVLAALACSHPHISVDVRISNTRKVAQAVELLQADIGLIEGSSHWSGLQVQPWIKDELVIVAAPSDALVHAAQSKPVGVGVLRQARWLLREEGSGTREMVEHALLPRLQQLRATATLGSSEAIARCVVQALGISCLPRVLVQSMLDDGSLVVLPTSLPKMERYFSIVQRTGKHASPALQAFLDACMAHAQP